MLLIYIVVKYCMNTQIETGFTAYFFLVVADVLWGFSIVSSQTSSCLLAHSPFTHCKNSPETLTWWETQHDFPPVHILHIQLVVSVSEATVLLF